MSETLLPKFSSTTFMAPGLTFKFLIHFEFIFVCGLRRCYSFISLHISVQFSQHHLLNKLSLAHCMFFLPLLNINWLSRCGFISGLSILFHWSMCLFLCQYHAVLITMTLQHSLKLGSMITPTLFIFLRITVAMWGLLCFHINFEIFALVLWNMSLESR